MNRSPLALFPMWPALDLVAEGMADLDSQKKLKWAHSLQVGNSETPEQEQSLL